MAGRGLEPIGNGSLRARAYGAIRDAIFHGRFRPGDPLRELELARDLGVSQATVREALLKLEHSGLVVRVPNRHTAVTRLSQSDLRERVELRILLESRAAVEASRRLDEAGFVRLRESMNAISRAVAGDDYFELYRADLQFHAQIWAAAGNGTLAALLDQLTAPLFAFVTILRSASHESLAASVLGHEPIVAALRSRDLAAIECAVRTHIEESYRRFLDAPAGEFESLAGLPEPSTAGAAPL